MKRKFTTFAITIFFINALFTLNLMASNITYYGPIKSTDTLWRIASNHAIKGVSTNARMQQIYEANPEAFASQDFGSLLQGEILIIPNVESVETTTQNKKQIKILDNSETITNVTTQTIKPTNNTKKATKIEESITSSPMTNNIKTTTPIKTESQTTSLQTKTSPLNIKDNSSTLIEQTNRIIEKTQPLELNMNEQSNSILGFSAQTTATLLIILFLSVAVLSAAIIWLLFQIKKMTELNHFYQKNTEDMNVNAKEMFNAPEKEKQEVSSYYEYEYEEEPIRHKEERNHKIDEYEYEEEQPKHDAAYQTDSKHPDINEEELLKSGFEKKHPYNNNTELGDYTKPPTLSIHELNDLFEGDTEISSKLNLARAYIEMGREKKALEMLNEISSFEHIQYYTEEINEIKNSINQMQEQN